jgi:UDP-3-O-[3-hydroxymyristoyl] glucosamine N-acyltransferase
MPSVPIREIVEFVAGEYAGPEDRQVTGVSSLSEATAAQLSFLANPKYAPQLLTTNAGVVLVSREVQGDPARLIRVDNPYASMARVVTRWFAGRPKPEGISPLASIAPSATLGAGTVVGPFVTIGENVTIDDNVVIYQNVSIEADCAIGAETIVYPNVSLYYQTSIGQRCIIHSNAVIGSDGYGFAMDGGRHHKIPQIGRVRIEDDVEVGAGTTIDRAALGETVIGEGTKIDNLVQIGHNVKIGKHCLLVSQSGVAGSSELGDYVVIAGQSGVAGHLKIAAGTQIAAKSAVLQDIPQRAKVMGIPSMPFGEFTRREVWMRRLPQLAKRLKNVEKKLNMDQDNEPSGE